MTGGSRKAREYNDVLARGASELGIGLGVGSQRAGIEKPEYSDSYSIVKEYDVPLVLANLGAPQFAGSKNGEKYGIEQVEAAIDMIEADAICIHMNYLQEVVQPEGDTYVQDLLGSLTDISKHTKVIIKETGAGISREAALRFKEIGVAALDIGGASGTSFSAVESYRSNDPSGKAERIGNTFREWGIPSPVSLRLSMVGIPVIASGGIRNGHDIVRALAMGADLGGMAWPLLEPASKGFDHLKRELEFIIEEVRIGLFLSGATSIGDVSSVKWSMTGISRQIMDNLFP
jgi:isopentenyl-diphosphate delta-isomerase